MKRHNGCAACAQNKAVHRIEDLPTYVDFEFKLPGRAEHVVVYIGDA